MMEIKQFKAIKNIRKKNFINKNIVNINERENK